MKLNVENKEIYVYIIGVIVGAIIYNCINMDFYFLYNEIQIDFFSYFAYQIISEIKYLIINIFCIFFKHKKIYEIALNIYNSIMIGGTVSIFIRYGTSSILASLINYIFRLILTTNIMKSEGKIKNISIAIGILIISCLLQTIFLKIF